jgi:hypothetical protein
MLPARTFIRASFHGIFKKVFYDRHLYKMLDYFAYATTYEDGVIEIFCEIYTKEAAVLVDKLSDLQIDLGIDNIEVSKALQSMMAEEPWQLYVTDKRNTRFSRTSPRDARVCGCAR